MKTLLIALLLAQSGYIQFPTSHATTQIHPNTTSAQNQQVQQSVQKLSSDMDKLQTLLESGEVDPTVLNNLLQKIIQDESSVYLNAKGPTHIKRTNIKRLPNVPTSSASSKSVKTIKVAKGDTGVSQKVLLLAENYIKTISLPILQTNTGTVPASGTNVVLFSNEQSYIKQLERAGESAANAKNIASVTGGLTVGNSVWIPLYNLTGNSDLANVLTHELTHVIMNQKGIGDTMPTWVNEGFAWYDGLQGMGKVSTSDVQNVTNQLNSEVQAVEQTGQLLPLTASESDILNARYNVEWVDHMAVQNLIQKEGLSKFQSFINGIAQRGVENSFESQYGESIETYQTDFMNSLGQ